MLSTLSSRTAGSGPEGSKRAGLRSRSSEISSSGAFAMPALWRSRERNPLIPGSSRDRVRAAPGPWRAYPPRASHMPTPARPPRRRSGRLRVQAPATYSPRCRTAQSTDCRNSNRPARNATRPPHREIPVRHRASKGSSSGTVSPSAIVAMRSMMAARRSLPCAAAASAAARSSLVTARRLSPRNGGHGGGEADASPKTRATSATTTSISVPQRGQRDVSSAAGPNSRVRSAAIA